MNDTVEALAPVIAAMTKRDAGDVRDSYQEASRLLNTLEHEISSARFPGYGNALTKLHEVQDHLKAVAGVGRKSSHAHSQQQAWLYAAWSDLSDIVEEAIR